MKTLKGNVIISHKRLRRLPMMNGKYLFEDVHVTGYFGCNSNQLTSLEGCPKEVGGDFDCYDNPGKFTEEDVRKVCKVRGKIYT